MNWLDILLVLPLVVGLVRGLMRGFISEVIAIVVVILGVLGARLAAPTCSAWCLQQFAWPQGVCDVVAYTLVFLAIAVILSVIARLLTKFLRAIHLGWANRLLGGAFGICKYGIIVLLAVFILDKTNEAFHYLDEAPVVKTSVVYPQMVQATHALLSFSGK
jgi:membrane protein required for colicin V production